jgi:hypothetical protein
MVGLILKTLPDVRNSHYFIYKNKYYLLHYNIGKHLLLDLELLKERNVKKSATKKVIVIRRTANFLFRRVSKYYQTKANKSHVTATQYAPYLSTVAMRSGTGISRFKIGHRY